MRRSRDADLVVRPDAYRLYWYFAAERQAIFNRRLQLMDPPWTDDPILQTHKFCNVYRASDRVSQYLIRQVAYNPDPQSDSDLLFQIVAFRLFSNMKTWDTIIRHLGRPPTIDDLASGRLLTSIERAKLENGGLYTGAFILCATDAFGQKLKHRNHVELLRKMFEQFELPKAIESAASMDEVFSTLKSYPLIGDFMAYQLAIDINYSELTDFSENDFVRPGPGAIRGIRKVFESVGGLPLEDVVLWMVEHQEEEFERLGLDFAGLFGRPLHAIDCQGLFCEVDKYCREALPELKSARSRIKQRFVASDEPMPLFFPPKWKIDVGSNALGLSVS